MDQHLRLERQVCTSCHGSGEEAGRAGEPGLRACAMCGGTRGWWLPRATAQRPRASSTLFGILVVAVVAVALVAGALVFGPNS